jgi:transposase
MEASGGYEKQPFALLWAQGWPVALLNPRAVRRFAEGTGLLEKTDRSGASSRCRLCCFPSTPHRGRKT